MRPSAKFGPAGHRLDLELVSVYALIDVEYLVCPLKSVLGENLLFALYRDVDPGFTVFRTKQFETTDAK